MLFQTPDQTGKKDESKGMSFYKTQYVLQYITFKFIYQNQFNIPIIYIYIYIRIHSNQRIRPHHTIPDQTTPDHTRPHHRSEERRVGKEFRSRWSPYN